MNSTPWLTILGVVPLVGALAVGLLPKGRDLLAKQVALGTSLVVLVLTAAAWVDYDRSSGAARFQFVQSHDWIKAFGVKYAVGVDGIALVLIGPGLRAFVAADANPELSSRLAKLVASGLEPWACGNTLRGMKLSVEALLPGFKVAGQGGVVKLAQLQGEGF